MRRPSPRPAPNTVRFPKLGCERLEDRTNPGTGQFTAGAFNFSVSVRFDATDAELQVIRDTFQAANNALEDATDGQHRFGTITLINNSKGGEPAEFWVHDGAGQANAPRDKYGIRGYHANLYFDSNFQAKKGAAGDSLAVVHEFAHLAYGLEDQFAGPNGKAEGAPVFFEGSTLSHTLMDNFFTRGGKSTANGAYTLNEFSVRSNHDPDGDTWQSWLNGKSDWEQIALSRFPAKLVTIPTEAPPAPRTVTFTTASGLLQSMLTIDNSNSMTNAGSKDAYGNTRLKYAKQGARAYLDFSPNGDGIGVVNFNKIVETKLPLTTISDASRTTIRNGINSIGTAANAGTDLPGGITASLNQITGQTDRTGNEVIILLSDGASFPAVDPSLYVAAVRDAGVAIYAIGVGGSIIPRGENDMNYLATQTGGRYYRVREPLDTQNVLLRVSQEIQGNGLAAESAQTTLAAATSRVTDVPVEEGADAVLFANTRENAADTVSFTVTSPSGKAYTVSSSGSNVEVVVDTQSQVIRIFDPEPGVWKMSSRAASGTKGKVQDFGYISNPGTNLEVGVLNTTATFPNAIAIRATPQFQGQPITGAAVTGTVTRPDGTTAAVTMYDDGKAVHGDAVPNDGTYSALFNGYNEDGTYVIDLKADGTLAKPVTGDAGLFPDDPAAPAGVPGFVRLGTASVIVSGVPATFTKTDLNVSILGPTDRLVEGDTATYKLRVRNTGLGVAGNVEANLHLPYGLTIGSATTTSGTTSVVGNVVQLGISTFGPNQTAEVTVTATATSTDAYFLWADVTNGSVIDQDLSNNRAELFPNAKTPPAISVITDASGEQDNAVGPIGFVVSDAESPPGQLVVTASSSNPALIPDTGIDLSGTDGQRAVILTPVGGQTGTAAVTLTVTDPDGMTFTRTFGVTINPPPPPPPPVNEPPAVSDVTDVSVGAGRSSGPIDFFISDPETPADQLVVEVISSNPSVLPNGAIVIGGSGTNRTLTISPLASAQLGSTVVTLSVRDPGGQSALDTFTVFVVAPPNLNPTISTPADVSIGVGQSTGPIAFTVGDPETDPTALIVSASSADTALFPATGLLVGGTGANRTVTVVPQPGASGAGTITLTVSDGKNTVTTSFNVTVKLGGGGGTSPPTSNPTPPTLVGYPQTAVGAGEGGGPLVQAYDPGKQLLFSGPVFADAFTGGVRTVSADFNLDGVADLVVGTGPGIGTSVRVLDGKTQTELFAVNPFEAAFTGGVYVAAGDITGDGVPDLVITPDEGGGPRVRVFNGAGFAILADFFGIDDRNFRGGARAAVGDVNGDGVGDIVVSAGFQGGPRVAGYTGQSVAAGLPARVFADFFAFEQTLRNGAFVAVGDVDGDGYADLIAGGGPGGGPRVTAFSGKALLANQYTMVTNFFAGDPENRGGIRVAVKDLDNDSRADLVVGSGSGAGSRVTAYLGKELGPSGGPATAFDFDAFPGFTGGVFVG